MLDNGRGRAVPTSPVDMGRGATIPVPPPESTRGPLLPPSLDTGRLGPSPLSHDTGQIPAVSAASLPPDLSWAASDDQTAVAPPPLSSPFADDQTTLAPPLSSPFASLGQAAPPPAPNTAPGRLLAAQPPVPTATPPRAMQAVPMPPNNGRHEGDPADHVVALSPDARAAVEATIGRNGGGPGGMPMAGATPDQMMSRSQLLNFLSSVRP
jgi:hypothetical protein